MFNAAFLNFFKRDNAVGVVGNVAVYNDGCGGYYLLDMSKEFALMHLPGKGV